MAELATFIEQRRAPTGPVETFSTEVATETVTQDIATEDTAAILLRFENGARGSVSISQISAGRKNSLQYEIDGSDPRSPGTPSSPTRSGSVIAIAPTRS